MSRHDYIALANLIRSVPGQGIGPDRLAVKLADFLAADSPRFDRARFYEAAQAGDGRGARRPNLEPL